MMQKTFSQWLTNQYLDWQKSEGDRKTVQEFADYLGVVQQSLSGWLNGNNIPKSHKAISRLAAKLGNEVYTLLGMEVPGAIKIPGYPNMSKMLDDYFQQLQDLGIPEDSPAAVQLLKEATEKYNINLIDKTRGEE